MKPAIPLLLCLPLLAGCESGITSASCHACANKSYSASDCAKWAAEAGCNKFEFLPTVESGCNNGCAFEDCDEKPQCIGGGLLPDAFVPDLDPACAGEDGLFPNCDLCQGECNQVNINGAVSWTCACGAPCPCGFQCGSIPLPVGGTIGSVCAPPP